MQTYLDPASRETATVLAAKLALAFLHSLSDTQDKRNLLPSDFYWAEELLVKLDAEGTQIFAEVPGAASEVNNAVLELMLTKGKQSF